MEEIILISYLNDFIFCPVSIYFHKLYGNLQSNLYKSKYQINGSKAHEKIDKKEYSSSKAMVQTIEVYSDEFKILGKIDILDRKNNTLIERKNKVNKIYDGYIFQVYAQYYALKEMGYIVEKIKIHSMSDNKNYYIKTPEEDKIMDEKFRKLIEKIHEFKIDEYEPSNIEKCEKCIYEPMCDRSRLC